jgi:predicted nucleic acid-binding protein
VALTAVDSSLLIAAVAPWHEAHARADQTLQQATELRMIAHVLWETFAWLTSNRPRTHPSVAASLLADLPGPPLVLSPEGHARLLEVIRNGQIIGGAVYDALIGATALEAGARLLSRDRRAARTYEAVGVRVELV